MLLQVQEVTEPRRNVTVMVVEDDDGFTAELWDTDLPLETGGKGCDYTVMGAVFELFRYDYYFGECLAGVTFWPELRFVDLHKHIPFLAPNCTFTKRTSFVI